jgi:hypothetical protein
MTDDEQKAMLAALAALNDDGNVPPAGGHSGLAPGPLNKG